MGYQDPRRYAFWLVFRYIKPTKKHTILGGLGMSVNVSSHVLLRCDFGFEGRFIGKNVALHAQSLAFKPSFFYSPLVKKYSSPTIHSCWVHVFLTSQTLSFLTHPYLNTFKTKTKKQRRPFLSPPKPPTNHLTRFFGHRTMALSQLAKRSPRLELLHSSGRTRDGLVLKLSFFIYSKFNETAVLLGIKVNARQRKKLD